MPKLPFSPVIWRRFRPYDVERIGPVPVRAWGEVPFRRRPWRRWWNRGRYVLSFTIEIPFRIPVADQWIAVLEEPNELGDEVSPPKVSISLVPSEHPPRLPQHLSVLPDWDDLVAYHASVAPAEEATRVEMTLWIGEAWAAEKEPISRCFDQGLRALNRLLMEYSLATLDPYCEDVEKERLPGVALMTFKDLAAPYYAHNFFRLHSADAPIKTALAPAGLEAIADRARTDSRGGLRAFHEARIRCGRSLEQGRYQETVMVAALAIESLVSWALIQRALDSGDSPDQVEDLFMRHGITRIVRTEMHGWLGGRWDTSDPGAAAGRWKVHVNDLRNRCAHRGYRPTYRQAATAFDAGKEFSEFIIDRLRGKGFGDWLDPSPYLEDPIVGNFVWEHNSIEDRPTMEGAQEQ